MYSIRKDGNQSRISARIRREYRENEIFRHLKGEVTKVNPSILSQTLLGEFIPLLLRV